ncbi:UNVERIFIED_CONTAM: putative small lipoprotein YifL [Paenibacillus sp. PvR008]
MKKGLSRILVLLVFALVLAGCGAAGNISDTSKSQLQAATN